MRDAVPPVGQLVIGLVGDSPEEGWLDIQVDRSSVLGNPFYDAKPPWKWLTDCVAYRRYLEHVLEAGPAAPADSSRIIAAEVARDFGVRVSGKWAQRPPLVGKVREELLQMRQEWRSGGRLRLLCHCARPFRELGGQFSPCHADAIADFVECEHVSPPSVVPRPVAPSEPHQHAAPLASQTGSIMLATERLIAIVCDCAGLRRDAGGAMEALLAQLPARVDPYRGRVAGGLCSLPGGLSFHAGAGGRGRDVVALYAQVAPGRAPLPHGPWQQQLGWAAEALGCQAVEDSESERCGWLKQAGC